MKDIYVIFYMLLHSFFIFQGAFAGGVLGYFKLNEAQQVQEVKSKQEQKEIKEPFSFNELPPDLQNLISEYAWRAVDNKQEFEEQLLAWKNADSIKSNSTSRGKEQNSFGFHASKKPIYFYTSPNAIRQVGMILNDAQPSDMGGFSYDSEAQLKTLLLFEQHDQKYKFYLQGEDRFENARVTSACFSVLGDFAFTWQDKKTQKHFYTVLALKSLLEKWQEQKQERTIPNLYLSDGAQEFNLKNASFLQGKTDNCTTIKGSLFNLDGTRLGVCSMASLPYLNFSFGNVEDEIFHLDHAVQYFEIESLQPLTLVEKLKRMGIATQEVKELLAKHKDKNKN